MASHSNSSRGIARSVMAVFVLQILVAGFCLMPAEAHAMPQMQAVVAGMDMHCGEMGGDAVKQHDGALCYHCEQPDEMSALSVAPQQTPLDFVAVAVRDIADAAAMQTAQWLRARTPTGPPRSASILYRFSQRIRI